MTFFQQAEDSFKPVAHKPLRRYQPVMPTGRQYRAARALLGWSVKTTTDQSGVSYATIYRIESVDAVPQVRVASLLALQRAYEDAGVIFLSPGQHAAGADGVRIRGGRGRPADDQ